MSFETMKAAGVLFTPGQVIEVRAIADERIASGYFNDIEKLVIDGEQKIIWLIESGKKGRTAKISTSGRAMNFYIILLFYTTPLQSVLPMFARKKERHPCLWGGNR